MKQTILTYLAFIKAQIATLDADTQSKYQAELEAFLNDATETGTTLSDEFTSFINNAVTKAKDFEAAAKDKVAEVLAPLAEKNAHVQGWLEKIRKAVGDDLHAALAKLERLFTVAAQFFGYHPNRDELYFTADHQAFYGENEANGHANHLAFKSGIPEDAEVTLIHRDHIPDGIAEKEEATEQERETEGTDAGAAPETQTSDTDPAASATKAQPTEETKPSGDAGTDTPPATGTEAAPAGNTETPQTDGSGDQADSTKKGSVKK